MAALQIRDLPDDVRAQLVARTTQLGVSMSEYVTRVLRDELSRPLIDEWAQSVRASDGVRPIDVVGALDEARVEYDPARPPQ